MVIAEVESKFPALLPWIVTCYGVTSHLFYGDTSIPSSRGLQQGDALASLCYSLAQQPVLVKIEEEVPSLSFHGWFLDDGSMVGDRDELQAVVDIVEREGGSRGLILSTNRTVRPPQTPKSTLWSPRYYGQEQDPIGRGVPMVLEQGVTLLGTPVGSHSFIRTALESKVEKIKKILALLPNLQDPHTEFVLLRACLSLPKMSFLLRTVNTSAYTDILQDFDRLQREALTRILGTGLNDRQWKQAQLPVSMGGLGLRGTVDHAAVSYSSSFLSTFYMFRALQGRLNDVTPASLPQDVLDLLTTQLGEEASVKSLWGLQQKVLSIKIDLKRLAELRANIAESGETREMARMASLQLPKAGAWLLTAPIAALGLHLSSVEFVLVAKYRLGCHIYDSEGPCPACLRPSDRYGDHALCCGHWGERITRHNNIRDHVHNLAASAVLNPTKEGRFILPGSDRRPADILLPNWAGGRDAALDVTVINPLQQQTVVQAADPDTQGYALTFAVDRKLRGAAEDCQRQGIVFLPLAFESLGGWHQTAVDEVKKIAVAQARQTGKAESKCVSHAVSRLSLLLMRGNAAILSNRFPLPSDAVLDGDIF